MLDQNPRNKASWEMKRANYGANQRSEERERANGRMKQAECCRFLFFGAKPQPSDRVTEQTFVSGFSAIGAI